MTNFAPERSLLFCRIDIYGPKVRQVVSLTRMAHNVPMSLEGGDLQERIREVQSFVERERRPVPDVLIDEVRKAKIALLGEHHIENELLHQDLRKALPALKREGVTQVFLEGYRDKQAEIDALDYSGAEDDVLAAVRKFSELWPIGWNDANLRTLIRAKQLGFEVIMIDDPASVAKPLTTSAQREYFQEPRVEEDVSVDVRERLPTRYHKFLAFDLSGGGASQREEKASQREWRIYESVRSRLSADESSKALIVIGSFHVSKSQSPIGGVERLGAKLVRQCGEERVRSFRYVSQRESIDDSYGTGAPKPSEVSTNPQTVVCLPDRGPVKGDRRVCEADFVIFQY